MKKFIALLFTAFLILPLIGCNQETIKIGVVLPDASEERWANQDGRFFKEELDALGEGYEYEILFSDGDEGKEKTNVESLISRGAEVIIITVEGSGAAAAQAANDAGVTLIAHDRMAKGDSAIADYYTTFNSWEVGKAQGQHLVDMADENGCSATDKCDLALFAGRTADWPNATYFFGGAMEALYDDIDMFNIINIETEAIEAIFDAAKITEANFDDDAATLLQAAMANIDTDWNAGTAGTLADALVATIDGDKSDEDVYVLAPNDDTSAAIRLKFADMGDNAYGNYYTTGQDASDVALASLMGDADKGQGTQTMTVFKDTSKLVENSVAIAKNVIDGKDGLDGLNDGPKIDGVDTAYTAIDTLTADNPQHTYDLIFATGYKDETDNVFSNINFDPYKD
ncbi:substrate-binding domain-containing protein [Mycoplasmatota bacterium]|nr:substrate-binding domain-containing protein [Mycoplasmatota bacterium]